MMSTPQPSHLGFVPCTPEVADKGQTDAGGDVVGAGDQPCLVAAQVKPPLDGGHHSVDKAVNDHPLEEGGHAEEEQHPLWGVESLNHLWCKEGPSHRDAQTPLGQT